MLALVAGASAQMILNRQILESGNFADQVGEWVRVGATPADERIEIVVAARQNEAAIKAKLDEVSDPENPKYGDYLTFEEVGALAIDKAAVAGVNAFLDQEGIPAIDRQTTPHGEYVTVSLPASKANTMLGTVFHTFEHRVSAERITRAAQYSVPVAVAPFVSFIGQVVTFPAISRKPIFHTMNPRALRGVNGMGCGTGVATPACIDSTYGIANNTVATAKSTNSVFETIGQSYVPSDVTAFDSKYNIKGQTVKKVIGPNNPSSCSSNPNNCVEAELDVQQITAIAQAPSKPITTFWSIPGSESFLQWTKAVAADANPPLVHSISYGEPESDGSASQQKAFDTEVQKLGTMGVSVLVASGDDGVAGSAARGNQGACGFNPSYPATAPHVTAVGATQGPESGSAEVACSSNTNGGITTGGGFSNTYTQPSYQSAAVAKYLKNGPNLPPSGKFNGAGRGYPDVGLMGHNYVIVVGGQSYEGSGTSASTPVFGAMITLINAERLNAGKKSLGFLNKALYSLDRSVYNDITSGENNCAAGSPGSNTCCQYGFTATAGWTPLTGLGSINFPKFKAALLALP